MFRRRQTSLVTFAASRCLQSRNESSKTSSGQTDSEADKNKVGEESNNDPNIETKADPAFFRAQQTANSRNPIDGPEYNQHIPGAGEAGYSKSLPTASKYRALTNDELIQMLRLRDKQIAEIRLIYENFHNEVEKMYRKQIFDYHDKAIDFSRTHGQMQNHSINHTREALVKLREQEELEHRDLKICYTVCIVSTFFFWLYCRKHYIDKKELEYATPTDAGQAPYTLRTQEFSMTPNLVNRLMGNSRETWFEKEKRLEREELEREQKERELAKQKKQSGSDDAKEEAKQQTPPTPVTSQPPSTPEDEARESIRKQKAWR